MRPTAAWRSTILSAADLAKKFKHPLFKVPGVSVPTLKLDILHLLDLGVSCYLYGNVLYSVMNGLGGTSKEANLASLNKLLVRPYDAQEVPSGKRIRPLHLSDIAKTSEEYTSLKHIKGARVRWLSPIMVELCKLYKAGKAPKHRLEAVTALNNMYNALKVPWQEWLEEASKTFNSNTENLLAHYSWLAKDAMQEGKHLYSMTQKHHVLCHMGSQAAHLHPATCWCYGSESFMSIMVHMTSSCTRGTAPHKVGIKALQKFRFVFHLVLAKHFSFEDDSSESSSE